MTPRTITKEAAVRRAHALAVLRSELHGQSFVEVTTPVLQTVRRTGPMPHSPFRIEGSEFDLRRSIELLLRTALAALPRVYDIGPAIRFDDGDKGPRSAVEFTLMELYAADLGYAELMELAERLIRATAMMPLPPLQRISVTKWFSDKLGLDFIADSTVQLREQLCGIVKTSDVDLPLWELINLAIERHLEPALTGFAFLFDYPFQTVCLARRSPACPQIAERFEAFIDGVEIGHGFVDETNADDVLARMHENGRHFVDESFVNRLKSGELPASAGFGIGIERLLAVTDKEPFDVRKFLHEYQHA